jgi:hypothetical protein
MEQTFTNPDGSTITVDCTWSPPPPVPPMLVGSACAANNVLAGHPTYAPWQQAGLAFNQPGHGLDPKVIAAGAKAGCLVCSCYKDDPTPDLLEPWLDAVYASGLPAWLNLDQEINANHYRSAPAYQGLVRKQLDIVAAHPAGKAGLVTCVEKFAGYAQDHGVGDWHDYWTGDCPGMLWDIYAQAGYPTPAAMYATAEKAAAEAAAVAKAAGRPFWWGIGETGLVWQRQTDPTGQGQADALASYVGHLDTVGARCVLVWDGPGAADFTCSTPARAAWRGLAAAARVAG